MSDIGCHLLSFYCRFESTGSATSIYDGFRWSLNTRQGIQPGDYLNRVTNGLGARAEWDYLPLSSDSVTAAGQPLYRVPENDADRAIDEDHFYFTSSMYVVSSFLESNGTDTTGAAANETRYTYEEAMYNNKGRGFQGFMKIVSEEDVGDGNDLTSVSLFHQKFPLAGRLFKSYTLHAGEVVGSRDDIPPTALTASENTWECQVFDEIGQLVTTPCSSETDFDTTKTYRPVLVGTAATRRSVEHRVAVTTTTTNTEHDAYGNVLYREVITADSDIEFDEQGVPVGRDMVAAESADLTRMVTTENEYYGADEVSWWLNKLKATSTTSVAGYQGTVPSINGVTSPDTAITKTTLYGWNDPKRKPKCVYVVGGDVSKTSTEYAQVDTCAASFGTGAPWTKTAFEYDQYGNPDRTMVSASNLPTSRATDYDYALSYGYFQNQASIVVKGVTHQTETTFDSRFGKPSLVTRPDHKLVAFKYDAFGMAVERYYPNTQNDVQSFTSAADQYAPRQSTRITDDAAWCPDRAQFKAAYCIVTIADGAPVTRQYVDILGRSVATRTNRLDTDSTESEPGTITEITYNARGQKSWESAPRAAEAGTKYGTTYSYDLLGRVRLKAQDRQLASLATTSKLYSHYQYEGLTTWVWVTDSATAPTDSCGNWADIDNVNGPEEPDSDLINKLCVSRTYASGGQLLYTMDAHGQATEFWHDGEGNPVVIRDPDGNLTGANYNALGHRTALFDPNMGNWTFAYNGLGELISQTDAKGQQFSFQYDELGRMTQRDAMMAEWTQSTTQDIWTFDSPVIGAPATEVRNMAASDLDNLTERFRRTYDYDLDNRPSGYAMTITSGAEQETYSVVIKNDDYFGRPISTTYPIVDLGDRQVRIYHKYDINGFLIQEGESADYDQPVPAECSPDTAPYLRRVLEIAPSGEIAREQYGNCRENRYAYYPATWQMARSETLSGVGTGRYVNLTYGYDRFGNLATKDDEIGGVLESFTYDRLHRMKTDSRSGTGIEDPVVSYTYDKLGNITSKGDYASNYVYEQNGEGPHAVSYVTGLPGFSASARIDYQFDQNGNLEMSSPSDNPDDAVAIAYNPFNKPMIIARDGKTLSFFEDPSHQRYRQVEDEDVDGPTTTYIGKMWEYRSGSDTRRHYIGNYAVWNISGNNAGLQYLHRDRLGSVVAVTNASGTLVGRANRGYGPFGKPRGEDGNSSRDSEGEQSLKARDITNRGFTQHEHLHDDVKLIHMNGRAYDYNLGRFLSVDPFIQFPENSQSLNPYSYLMNNPMSGTDPSGYCGNFDEMETGDTVTCEKYDPSSHTVTQVTATKQEDGSIAFTHGSRRNGATNSISLRGSGGPDTNRQSISDIGSSNSRTDTQLGLERGLNAVRPFFQAGETFLDTIRPIPVDAEEVAMMVAGGVLLKIGGRLIRLGGDEVAVDANDALQLRGASRNLELTGVGKNGATFYPFTKENFRTNLKILTRKNPNSTTHAHHVFPKDFADSFAELGINVHDPRFGAWLGQKTHYCVHNAGCYNARWQTFLDNDPTTAGAFRFANELSRELKFADKLNFDIQYR